jgi:4-hydroxybenzoate polyprenyltransferase
MKFVKKIIRYFENEEIPLLHYLIGFIFIVLLRNFIELYATNQDQHLLQVFTYSPFYFALAFWFILLFHFLTKERVVIVARIVLVSFILILIPPVADLIIKWGAPVRMKYIGISDLKSIIENYFTILFSFKNNENSIGQRIEIIISTILSFFYFYYKIQNIWKSILCAISVYTSIFFFGIFTYLTNLPFQWFKIEFVNDDLFMERFFFLFSIIILIITFYRYNKNFFFAIIRDLRYERLIYFIIMFVLGYVLFLSDKEVYQYAPTIINSMNCYYFFLIPVSIIFSALFTIIINNIQDIEADRISNINRPLVTQIIPMKPYLRIAWLSLVISLIAALLVNRTCFILMSLIIGSYYVYSCPPFRLKRIPFLSKFIVGMNSFLMCLMGFSVFGAPVLLFPESYTFFILIPLSLAGNFLDIKDYDGDKATGVITLPVLFGKKTAKFFISFFTFCSYLNVFFIIKNYHLGNVMNILPFILCIFHILFIYKRKYNEKLVFVVLLIGLIALILIQINQ